MILNGTPEDYGLDGLEPGISFSTDRLRGPGQGHRRGARQLHQREARRQGRGALRARTPPGTAGKEEHREGRQGRPSPPPLPTPRSSRTDHRHRPRRGPDRHRQRPPGQPRTSTPSSARTTRARSAPSAPSRPPARTLPCLTEAGGNDEVLAAVKDGKIYASVALQFAADMAQSFDALATMIDDPTADGRAADRPAGSREGRQLIVTMTTPDVSQPTGPTRGRGRPAAGPAPVPTGHDVPAHGLGAGLPARPRHLHAVGTADRGLRVLVLAVLLHGRQRPADRERRRPHRALRGRRRHRHHDRRPRPVAARHGGDRQLRLRLAAHPRPRHLARACWPGLACGVVVGLVNGFITLRGFNPIIVTIGTLSVLTGLAAVVAGGYTFPGLTQLEFMGTHRYFRIGDDGRDLPGHPGAGLHRGRGVHRRHDLPDPHPRRAPADGGRRQRRGGTPRRHPQQPLQGARLRDLRRCWPRSAAWSTPPTSPRPTRPRARRSSSPRSPRSPSPASPSPVAAAACRGSWSAR